jgi:hypothetical protein
MKNKIACVYHSIDLDGWCSAGIVKYCWCINNSQYEESSLEENFLVDLINPLNNIKFIGYNYGQPVPDLSSYDSVIMCDISFPKEFMLELNLRLGKRLIWIDHHQRTVNEVNSYIIEHGIPMEGLVTVDGELKAACELTWEYFFKEIEIPEFVRRLGRYDCFGHKGTLEENLILEFQYGAREVIVNYEQCYNIILNCFAFNIEYLGQIGNILRNGKAIYSFLCTDAKQSYKNGFEIELKETEFYPNGDSKGVINIRKFICINKERFNPINFGIDYHKEGYDGCACFHYAKGKYNFSLYNDNGKVDCSSIAKQFGGGGHKGASGFILNQYQFLELIK